MAAVLFTDLVGSTELLSRLGEAAFDGLRRAHFAALREAIGRSGGAEVKGTGDGVLATFSSAADAVGCAVGMQQAVEVHARTAGVPLAMRIGVSLGDISFEDGDVYGTPVVEAARLVAAARGGQILASAVVRLVAGGRCAAMFTDLGSLELKGLPEPVPTWEVAWEPLRASPVPVPGLLTEVGRVFVGREREMARLHQLWQESSAGEVRVALLAGEPGIGKTRLAAELATQVHDDGAVVLAGRCDEDLGVPYQPFVEALRHFVDHTAEPQERLGRYGGELTRLVPELSDRVAGLPLPLSSDPETERYRLFDAVAAWLAAESEHQPVLLVLDDLQWAAKPTLLLLRHVVRSSDTMRVLVLATYRDTELGHEHPLVEVVADLRRQGSVERISLTGLDSSAVLAFMEQAAGHSLDDEDLALAQAVHEETEGNPFFVREVLRHLTETGAIEWREGRWGTRLPVEELGIPESVRDVIGRRLSRLSEAANQALRTAAVVGPEFDVSVVQAAGGLGEDVLLSSLEEATEARLVIEATARRYRFAHALVRDSLYGELSAARRVAAHHRVAQAIEDAYATRLDDHLPALAHHWARASAPAAETGKAVEYAARAGDRALAQLAHDEAVAYYRQALELIDVGQGPHDEARRLELLISLGEAQRRAGDPVHRLTLLDAARLAQGRGDADALARAALANTRGAHASAAGTVDDERIRVLEAALEAVPDTESASRARLLATLGLELTWAPDRERRVGPSNVALAMARRLSDPQTLGHVLLARFVTIWGPSTLAERLALCDELIAMAEEIGDPALSSRAWWLRFRALTETGNVPEAEASLGIVERLAADLGQPALGWLATWSRAGLVLVSGRIEEADRLFLDGLHLGEAAGEPDAITWYAIEAFEVRLEDGRLDALDPRATDTLARRTDFPLFQAAFALLHCEQSRRDEARALLRRFGDGRFAGVPVDPAYLRPLTLFADATGQLADADAAGSLYSLLAPYANQFPAAAGLITGCVAHFLGILATTLARFDEAERHFAAAEAAHARLPGPGWLARTRLEWARMLLTRRASGDAERARQLLGQALETARELGLANVERRTVTLLGQVS